MQWTANNCSLYLLIQYDEAKDVRTWQVHSKWKQTALHISAKWDWMKKLNTTAWTLDLTWYSCYYALKYYTFLESTSSCRDCIRIPLLLSAIKSSLPVAETSFSHMFSSSSLLVLLLLFHSQICIMELLRTKTQKLDLWWQPSCSILSNAQREQLLAPFLQKDVLPNSEPPFLFFDVFKTLNVSKLLGDALHLYDSLVLE